MFTGCISDSHDQPASKKKERFEIDTVINGVHIQQNGRIPTKEDFISMYKVGKPLYDSLRNMSQADKDSIVAAYKRSILEGFRKK